MSNLMNKLTIKDTAFDSDRNDKVIYYRQTANQDQPLYKVWIYLDGPSLPFVKQVRYILHPTFADPERVVARTVANPNCELIIWTWGIFTVTARVEDKEGNSISLEHYLTYGQQLEDPKVEFRRG